MTHPLLPLPLTRAPSPDTPDPDPTATPHPDTIPDGDLTAAMMSAAANRPVEDVADLLCHLNSSRTSALTPALHQAVAARAVEDLAALLALLRPRDRPGADQILRTAVLTRPTGDVAHLSALLATEPDTGIRAALHAAASLRPVGDVAHLAMLLQPAPAPARQSRADGQDTDHVGVRPDTGSGTEPPVEAGPRTRPRVLSPARVSRKYSFVRWPAAASLLATGALHLPLALSLWERDPAAATVITVLATLCLIVAVLLIRVRYDAPLVWSAATATGATTLTGYLLADSLLLPDVTGALAEWWSYLGPAALVCETAVIVLAIVHTVTGRPWRGSTDSVPTTLRV
ncbi:hypothetical protein [Kitasatospora sp. NPDC059327]|uniref:hypothetical protein n=1 Tax=Kitasatospora sp. NPDC059327 TaxID=3346803 RepID=UPI0036932B36